MSLYQWLLALHVSGAFLVVGATVAAGALRVLAQRARLPSEVALFLGLVRFVLPALGIGVLITLVLGLWLVHEDGYPYGQGWIVASLVLWVLVNAFGGIGGRRERETREFAEGLAAAGDVSSDELRARLRDPAVNVLSAAAGLAVLAILALMIWQPGA